MDPVHGVGELLTEQNQPKQGQVPSNNWLTQLHGAFGKFGKLLHLAHVLRIIMLHGLY